MEIVSKGMNVAMKNSQGESLKSAMIGLGWDAKNDAAIDVDLAVLQGRGGNFHTGDARCRNTGDLCYFGALTLPGLSHSGDNRTGDGDGDDERLKIDFTSIPTDVTALGIFADLYSGSTNFGSINNVKLNVYDNHDAPNTADGLATAKFSTDLSEDFSGFKNVLVGEFYRHDGGWKYKAIGEGTTNSLRDGGLDKWETN